MLQVNYVLDELQGYANLIDERHKWYVNYNEFPPSSGLKVLLI